MVDMAVRVDHRLHRLLAAMSVIEIHPDLGGLGRYERIDDGDAFGALDDGHVGQIEIADLIQARDDLEQAADIDQLSLTPQAGIDRVRRVRAFRDEAVLPGIPDRIA